MGQLIQWQEKRRNIGASLNKTSLKRHEMD